MNVTHFSHNDRCDTAENNISVRRSLMSNEDLERGEPESSQTQRDNQITSNELNLNEMQKLSPEEKQGELAQARSEEQSWSNTGFRISINPMPFTKNKTSDFPCYYEGIIIKSVKYLAGRALLCRKKAC